VKKFVHNVAERIKSVRQGRHGTEYQILWDEKDVRVQWLTMENTEGSLSFSWEAVLAVDTFKRDLFTVDGVCLAFQTTKGWIEVNEDMKGWHDFLGAAERHLDSFPAVSSWLGKVTVPAFKTNHARLWQKHTGSQNNQPEATAR